MDNCIPETTPQAITPTEIIAPRPAKTYDELAYEVRFLRKKNSDRKKALQTLNKKMAELQLMLSNQQWKAKMWEQRVRQRDVEIKLRDNAIITLRAMLTPWYKKFFSF